MRLLTWTSATELSLTKDFGHCDDIPPYAILSHTWYDNDEEVTFADIESGQGRWKEGYRKIEFCGEQARKDGYNHFWVDTCCIDKKSHSELSEAITSMFRWYKRAAKCYVYLADVSARECNNTEYNQQVWHSSFESSRWFRRGWTLQELLAPSAVEFFSRDGDYLGTKETLAQQIHEITTIPLAALLGAPLTQFPPAERLRWSAKRETNKPEDKAYCLLGIFNVFIPLMYGEGDNALRRLTEEIDRQYGSNLTNASGVTDHPRSLGLCLTSAPLIQPDEFVGRAVEIKAMSEILGSGQMSVGQRRVVLGGMGGVGKTQLAIAYARQYESEYTSVCWLSASSEATLHTSIRSVVKSLVDAESLAKLNNEQILARFHEWLSMPQNRRWLLIFDNYDEPTDFNIDSFCPNVGQGSIIITTRLPDLVRGHEVRVQVLQDINSSLAVLQVRSGRQAVEEDPGARLLAQRLGGLPLALVTAGSYLRKSVISFQQYLDAYEQRWQVDRHRPLHLKEYKNRTLYTTWDLSFTRLEKGHVEAALVLRLLAYFDNQDFWYELLSAGDQERLPRNLCQVFSDQFDFENVMTTLVDYCFVEVQTIKRSYSIHNCVHDWTLTALNKTIHQQSYWYAFSCVARSIDHDDWNALNHIKYGRLTPHAVRLVNTQSLEDKSFREVEEHILEDAHYIARLLEQQVQPFAAEQMYLRILAEDEKVLGPDHISTLSTVNNLGVLYQDQGKLLKAEEMYERALAGYKKALGPDHVSTLSTVNNLGVLYQDQGKLQEAEEMYERALAGREKTLGPDHVSTLDTVNNLGNLYRTQGKLQEAEEMWERALAGREKTLGPDYVSTLNTVYNLGVLYRTQGKLLKAEEMYERALARYEKVLGPDHISTLDTVNNLGILYRAQRKLQEAEEMHERALAGYEKVLGPDHLSTLNSKHDLANLYVSQGKLDKAESIYLLLLPGYERAIGDDHPETILLWHNFGILREEQNKLEDAEQMYTRARRGFAKRLGENHPKTCDAANCLANLHRRRGEDRSADVIQHNDVQTS